LHNLHEIDFLFKEFADQFLSFLFVESSFMKIDMHV